MLQKSVQDEIVRRIVEAIHPLKIVLFGSYAYGAPEKESDIDLAVIVDRAVSKSRESVKLWQLLSDIPFAKDILVASRDEYEFYKNEAGSVFRTINEKGVEIYAR